MSRHQSSDPDFDSAQLAQIYRDHASALRRQANRYLRDDRMAEDVVQEAFMRMIALAPTVKDRRHGLAYLSTAVTNLSLNRIRDIGRRPLLEALDSVDASARLNHISSRSHRDQEFDLIEQARSEQVRAAIARLEPRLRIVLVMRDLQDRSVDDIARQLLIKPNYVRTLVSQARASLRRILEAREVSRDLRLGVGDFGLGTGGRHREKIFW